MPWLGGADAAPALRLPAQNGTGRTLSYGELRDLVENYALAPSGIVHAANGNAEAMLVCVLAALHRERAVLVSDPAQATPALRSVPASTGLVVMTSGSSGRARAVARTASSWHESFTPFTAATGLSSADTVALSGPLHVSMHLFAALHTLWLGAELRTDATTASAVHCTPTVLGRLLSAHSVPRRLIVAGAALPEGIRALARERGAVVTEYYGAAELSFVAIGDKAGALRAFPGVEIELRADTPSGSTLWARSPYLSLGYAELAGEPVHAGALLQGDDGFASVGDLAEMGDDGALLVRGRGDSAVTTAGSTVLSEDIERTLETISGVVGAAVIAEAHPVLGEIIVAVLERIPSTRVTEPATAHNFTDAHMLAAVRAESSTLLSPVERPRRWLLVDELPRTASGKLAKGALRAGLESGTIHFSEFGATADV